VTTDNVVSTRNLIDPDIGPLRRVVGILDSMPTEDRTFGEGSAARTSKRISLNIRDIEVLEAVEPYHLPIFTININQSNRKKSRWGVLGESFNQVVDSQLTKEQLDPTNPAFVKPENRMDIKDALGKKIGLVMSDGVGGRPEPHMLFDGRTQKDEPTTAWMVYMVDGARPGVTAQSAWDIAVELLNGKTLADFNTLALANPSIRSDTALLQAVSKPLTAADSFANTMVDSGQFIRDTDTGVYTRMG
jgi:hypothetical protein